MRVTHRASLALAGAMLAVLAAFSAAPALAADGVATLGSPPPEEGAGSAPTPPQDPMDGLLDFAACMREHGVEMPDPQMSGDGVLMVFEATSSVDIDDPPGIMTMDEDFMAAEEACREHLGTMGPAGDPVLDAEVMEGMLAYADCMRQHGIEMPDPQMVDGGFMIGSPGSGADSQDIDPFSEGFQAAEEACRDVMPFEDLGAPSAAAP